MKTSQKSYFRSRKFKLHSTTRDLQFKVVRLAACSLMLFVLMFASCQSGVKKTEAVVKSDETGIAKFVFSEEIHNFGSLNAGEIVSYTFIFRNEGSKTLQILEVDSGCGCTEVNIPDKEIKPGEEGRIEVIYNSSGETGKQLKAISIKSNAETPTKQIFIKADVTNEIIEINS